ncbi:MAG: SGNH/GDSL hydrolase family protein [Conexibacter sp.]
MTGRPAAAGVQPFARYVALGDSFSAGAPGQSWTPWPHLLTELLERGSGSLRLVVLARAGTTAAQLHAQVPEALRCVPDLVTVMTGANDVLLAFRPDIAAAAASVERALATLRAHRPAARVLVLTYPPFLQLPYRNRSKLRVLDGMRRLNDAIRASARRTGAELVDLERHPWALRRDGISADGVHPSAIGHRRVACCVQTLLGPAPTAAQPATEADAPTIAPMSASRSPEAPETFT